MREILISATSGFFVIVLCILAVAVVTVAKSTVKYIVAFIVSKYSITQFQAKSLVWAVFGVWVSTSIIIYYISFT